MWERAGATIATEYKYAGDFDLWIRFFQIERLYNINALLGSFRLSVAGQASQDHYKDYLSETFHILKKYPLSRNERYRLNFGKWLVAIERLWSSFFLFIRSQLKIDDKSVLNNKVRFNNKTQKFILRDRA